LSCAFAIDKALSAIYKHAADAFSLLNEPPGSGGQIVLNHWNAWTNSILLKQQNVCPISLFEHPSLPKPKCTGIIVTELLYRSLQGESLRLIHPVMKKMSLQGRSHFLSNMCA
jgi:hypothetical protein